MSLKKTLSQKEFNDFVINKMMSIELLTRQMIYEQRYFMNYFNTLAEQNDLLTVDLKELYEVEFAKNRRKLMDEYADYFDLDDLDDLFKNA